MFIKTYINKKYSNEEEIKREKCKIMTKREIVQYRHDK